MLIVLVAAVLVAAGGLFVVPQLRAGRTASTERGEGVVSVAIAVLIMAVLGAILFAQFKTTTEKAAKNTDDRVNEITK
jgi:putative copper export protein